MVSLKQGHGPSSNLPFGSQRLLVKQEVQSTKSLEALSFKPTGLAPHACSTVSGQESKNMTTWTEHCHGVREKKGKLPAEWPVACKTLSNGFFRKHSCKPRMAGLPLGFAPESQHGPRNKGLNDGCAKVSWKMFDS